MKKIRLLGSYYSHDKLGVIRITGIKRDSVLFTNKVGHEFEEIIKSNMIYPIKLTKDWFLKFGFTESNWTDGGVPSSFNYQKECSLLVATNQEQNDFWIDGHDDSDITTVNQLQELYLGWSGGDLLEIVE